MKNRNQETICEFMKVNPDKPNPDSIIGLAIKSLGKGIIHGLRHHSKQNSNGWYIWSGEYSKDEDFFHPICVKYIENYLDKKVIEYLDLPSGYRFLIDGDNYEDIWFDEKLLNDD
jgi:hypothetical protein